MPFGIGLTLDERTGERVCDLWRAFEKAGVGKTPGQLGLPPHVTLSLFADGDPAVLAAHVALAHARGIECDRLYTPGKIVFHCMLSGGDRGSHLPDRSRDLPFPSRSP